MQDTSAGYKSLLISPHEKEYRIVIAKTSGTESYLGDAIVSPPKVTNSIFSEDKFSIGGVHSGSVTFSVLQKSVPPIMAQIQIFVRLKSGSTTSEWLPKGQYYIYSRDYDEKTNVLQVTAYDILLLTEQIAYTSATGFPKTMRAVVYDICTALGVTLNPDTVVSDTLVCEFDSTMTMREYLSLIAAAHGGNWIADEAGRLKLVRPFEQIDLLVDENDNVIIFGEDAIIV